MGELDRKSARTNVNVMLEHSPDALEALYGKEFPCPLCGAGLPLQRSKRNKPYCICNVCGVQLFVRGKVGITRLLQMGNDAILVSARDESAGRGFVLLNRLEQLKLQKGELEQKRGFFFPDPNVVNAIEIVDAEIASVQGELAKMAGKK